MNRPIAHWYLILIFELLNDYMFNNIKNKSVLKSYDLDPNPTSLFKGRSDQLSTLICRIQGPSVNISGGPWLGLFEPVLNNHMYINQAELLDLRTISAWFFPKQYL